jgi:tight adherence protein C
MTVAVILLLVALVVDRRVVAALGSHFRQLIPSANRRESDAVLLADLTTLGLSAGLSFPAALGAAAEHLSEESAQAVRRALRSPAERVEAGPATALLALADRALVTGAPLLASIDGYATSLRRDERAAAVEKARRLPVKLLFPLALLILPGFLLLTVGPALLAGLDRLGL